ncbi:NAD-dependent succinate-semialdehyde dehydrogenase [Photobacterium angustum]|uniref:NAD-dependent succinate-semialdehyde dehydrogenase n=1 Tax=Photobacterium angustum TaxID=661 RepID=A0A855SHJ2_PHOAN|nr:NAD-dependent succinate-semialdehyde dehydrogenase [Photobacterium angustum]KJG37894.1 succinate-semialdehyde dehydrogenase [Photobacterium angustum]KJG47227.1 succinate-semialdehyde dehydrogenase [Photobacterium angustum]KJG51541.1 succinate-semialdehyde dehydrogenase [Photobacterium angustum]PSX07282.1 NAD-dependent succinate-semialdehyde dehydrogenase [Photobacterium angustum]PSX15068.1 NAD-dependent succinate-semialdehyde dehydrogenase [Photobacterium angustum]
MTFSFGGLFKQQAFINGQWSDAFSGKTVNITNPATNEVIGHVPLMGVEETNIAIDAADKAYRLWSKKTAKHRSLILRQWYELIVSHSDELAHILTAEQGKPLAEAKGEIAYAASFVEWYAEEAKRLNGEIIPSHKEDARILVSRQPVGVVAAITPWNFPAAMITRKCGPAFAAGCSVVLKPAPDTPYTAFALAELAHRAGIPTGLFNVITGDAVKIGAELMSNKRVRKVSFTGSTAIGKLLMAQSAATVKKVSLELGGNAPFIVFDDADLSRAIDGVMVSKFRNAGQTCVCTNRIYVHSDVYQQFVEKLAEKVSALTVGNGVDNGVTIGPLINRAAVEKVEKHINDAMMKGANLVTGTREASTNCFVQPTVLSNVTDNMLVASEETFGPLAAVFKFTDEQDVITRANNTDSGLAAYVYTQSLSRAFRVSEALEYGMVGVNEGLISTELAPFGGVKESGIGREGAHQGLEEYTEMKYTLMGGL